MFAQTQNSGDFLTILELNLLEYPLHDKGPIPRFIKSHAGIAHSYASLTFETWHFGFGSKSV